MIDRRAGPTVLLALAAIVAGCLPSSTGPASSAATGSVPAAETPTSTPSPSGPSPSPSFVRPTPTPMPTFMVYVVKRGDSLNTIAHRFGTKARSIAFWNRASYPSLDPESSRYSPNSIQVGWMLILIPGVLFDENAVPDATSAPIASPSF
jgi:nucleoid-associated protein YgaU